MRLSREEFREHLVDYLYGELAPALRESFEACLEESADCRRELAALRETLAHSRSSLPLLEEDPPARLAEALRALPDAANAGTGAHTKIAAPSRDRPPQRASQARPSGLARWLAWLAGPAPLGALSVAAIATVGVLVHQARRESFQLERVHEPSSRGETAPEAPPHDPSARGETAPEAPPHPSARSDGAATTHAHEPSSRGDGAATTHAHEPSSRGDGAAKPRASSVTGPALQHDDRERGTGRAPSHVTQPAVAPPPPSAAAPSGAGRARMGASAAPAGAAPAKASDALRAGAAHDEALDQEAEPPAVHGRSAASREALAAPSSGGASRRTPGVAQESKAVAPPPSAASREATPEALEREAQAQVAAHRLQEAVHTYETLLRRYPSDARAPDWQRRLARVQRALTAPHSPENPTP